MNLNFLKFSKGGWRAQKNLPKGGRFFIEFKAVQQEVGRWHLVAQAAEI